MIPIIYSALDTDLYKFTMQQAIYHQFPSVNVEYRFKCRNKADWTDEHINEINRRIDRLCATVRFDAHTINYLKSIRFFKQDYLDFLSIFQLNRDHIKVYLDDNRELQIEIAGSWLFTILFEVPILAIVNEVYFDQLEIEKYSVEGKKRLEQKIEMVRQFRDKNPGFVFADFGTRRRFCFDWQQYVVRTLKEADIGMIGTSNVLFAYKYDIKPIGTMAHEWLQAGQALDVRLVDSQKRMLQAWVDEYRGDLGIALTDVVGIDAFLRDFDLYFAKLYDGVRHDSGDPVVFAEKIINHYKNLRIDPKTKTIVFSDGLDFEKAFMLYEKFHDQIGVSFGIGTNLTNDVGVTPLQIVLKMTECNGQPVAKISDSKGKGMCRDEGYLTYLKSVFHIEDK